MLEDVEIIKKYLLVCDFFLIVFEEEIYSNFCWGCDLDSLNFFFYDANLKFQEFFLINWKKNPKISRGNNEKNIFKNAWHGYTFIMSFQLSTRVSRANTPHTNHKNSKSDTLHHQTSDTSALSSYWLRASFQSVQTDQKSVKNQAKKKSIMAGLTVCLRIPTMAAKKKRWSHNQHETSIPTLEQ